MKSKFIRIVAATLAVVALAVGGSTAASADSAGDRGVAQRIDTSWG